MKKQTIRLNESQFNSLVKECVKQILKEGYTNFGDYSFLYEKFPVGGQITYHSKNGTTGGKLQKIFPLDGENMLVFAWSNNRGLAINDGIRETNALLPQHKSYKPKAKLVGNDGDGWKTIDEGGYAVYENPQDNLHERTASEEGMTDDEVRLNENSLSKEGFPRRIFHFGEKFGNWELVLKDGRDYCLLRPISKNHIMPDGTHWDTVDTNIPADMFDKPQKELEEYLVNSIMTHYNKIQDFYKNWKPSKTDDFDDDRLDYMYYHPSIYRPSKYDKQ